MVPEDWFPAITARLWTSHKVAKSAGGTPRPRLRRQPSTQLSSLIAPHQVLPIGQPGARYKMTVLFQLFQVGAMIIGKPGSRKRDCFQMAISGVGALSTAKSIGQAKA